MEKSKKSAYVTENMKSKLIVVLLMFFLVGSVSATSTFYEDMNIMGDGYYSGNLSVWDLVVRSGNSIHLSGATFSNEDTHTEVDTNWGVHNDEEPTAYLGVYAHNGSLDTIANFILEAGNNTDRSAFNIVKHNANPASGIVNIINEDGNIGSFVNYGDSFTWNYFENITRDEYGNLGEITGIQPLVTLDNDSITFENNIDLYTGGNIYMGNGIGLTSAGHHILAVIEEGHEHVYPHSLFSNGTTEDVRMIDAYNYRERDIIIATDDADWTGTTFEFELLPDTALLIKYAYYKTGATAATEPVRIQTWHGTDDTGKLIFDETYSVEEFPASTEIQLLLNGYMELEEGQTHFIRHSSNANFSIRTDGTNTLPWLAFDVSDIRHGNMIQTTEWINNTAYPIGKLMIYNRTIYVSNDSSTQTESFNSNLDKWRNIADSGSGSGYDGGDLLVDGNLNVTTNFTVGDERIVSDEVVTALQSPSLNHFLSVDNTGAFYDSSEIITVGNFPDVEGIVSPNEITNLTLSDSDLVYYDGTRDRLDITAVHSKFYSPDGDYTLIDNERFVYNDGTRNRLEINAAGSMLVSPSGSHSLIIDNTGAFYDGSEIITIGDVNIANWDTAYGWGNHDGLYSLLNHKESKLSSPDNLKNLTLNDSNLIFDYDGSQRFIIDNVGSGLFSPDGNKVLLVTNAGTYANGEVILTSSDLLVDRIISPDTLSNLTIDNTSLIYTNSNGEKRFEIDGTQTRIRGVGATPIYIKFGSSSFEINDGVDRFMSNSDKTIMASANDVWWSSVYDDRYEVMDDVRARIIANAINTTLVSPDGGDILSVADNEFTYNDNVSDRILVNSVTSRLISQGGAYISSGDTGSYINDGTRSRVRVDSSHTYLFSPSGTKWVDVSNTGTAITGNAVFNDGVGIGNDGLTITSSDLTPSFNIVGNGDIFKMKQAQGTNGFFISFYDNNNVRKSYIGHGSSSSQEDFSIGNEEVGGDIILVTDSAGIVVIETDLKVTDLAGSGNDYVCVNSVGQMFRSSAGC